MGMNKRIYKGRASQWALGESKNGKEQVAVLFTITTEGAPEAALTWYGYFTEKTADRTLESLRHCGWTGDNLLDLQGLDANEVELVVEDEEYEGKTYTKVQWVNRPGALAVSAPMPEAKARAFAAAMRDRVRALDAAAGKKPAPRQSPKASSGPPEPPPHTDSDMPF